MSETDAHNPVGAVNLSTAGLLTRFSLLRLLAVHTAMTLCKDFKKLTAAGTVPDSHRIPF